MEFGAFVSGLASLPRIVTIHNVKIEPHKKDERAKKTAKNPLVMSAAGQDLSLPDEEPCRRAKSKVTMKKNAMGRQLNFRYRRIVRGSRFWLIIFVDGLRGDDLADLKHYVEEVKARRKGQSSLCRNSGG